MKSGKYLDIERWPDRLRRDRFSYWDTRYAPAAIEQLRLAVDGFGPTYARSRAVNLPGLAGSYFRIGELDSAVTIGHEAVTEISALSSKRAYARLKTLTEAAAPFEHNRCVADLGQRIREALVIAA